MFIYVSDAKSFAANPKLVLLLLSYKRHYRCIFITMLIIVVLIKSEFPENSILIYCRRPYFVNNLYFVYYTQKPFFAWFMHLRIFKMKKQGDALKIWIREFF